MPMWIAHTHTLDQESLSIFSPFFEFVCNSWVNYNNKKAFQKPINILHNLSIVLLVHKCPNGYKIQHIFICHSTSTTVQKDPHKTQKENSVTCKTMFHDRDGKPVKPQNANNIQGSLNISSKWHHLWGSLSPVSDIISLDNFVLILY